MDILVFLLILAGIGILPRFGVDDAVKGLLSDAWAVSRETYFAMRRRYVHLAAGPMVTVTCIAMAFQALALTLAWGLMPYSDGYLLTIAGAILIILEGVMAYRSRLAIPHWRRDADGLMVRFPAHLPEREYFRAPLVNNQAAVILDDQGRFVNARGQFARANGTALPHGAAPVVSPLWGTMVDWHGVPTPIQDVPDVLERVRVRATPEEEFVDDNGRLVNAVGQFVNAEHGAVAEDAAELHEQAGAPVLDPAHRHEPGNFSLGRSLGLLIITFLVIGVWIAALGITAEKTSLFMVGVVCVYAMLAAVAVLANIIAWFLLKGTKLLEFVATVVSKEVLVALPGIKWSNIETYLPQGVNILEEEAQAAAIRALPVRIALHLAPFVALVWTWTTPVVALFAVSFTFITGFCGWHLAKRGGSLEVENRTYQFARLMFYGLPAVCVLGFVIGFLPKDVKSVFTDQMFEVPGPWQNVGTWFLALITGILSGAVAFSLTPSRESGKPRRWFYNGAMMLTGLCFIALILSSVGLAMNIWGQKTVGLPATSALSKTASVTGSASPVAAASPKSEETKPDRTPPAPAPTVTAKPPSGGSRDKPPSRYARVPGSPAPNSPRWKLDPEFVTEYRAVTGENP